MRKALLLVGLAGLLTTAACGKDKVHAVGEPAATTTPAATTQTTTEAPTPATTPGTTQAADPNGPVLGPDGFQKIKLGATEADLKAAGLTLEPTNGVACPNRVIVSVPDGGIVGAQQSVKHGVSTIIVQGANSVHTPEGIKIDSTLAEVQKAYPDLKDINGGGAVSPDGGAVAAVPGNAKAQYNFIMGSGKVSFMLLNLLDNDCT